MKKINKTYYEIKSKNDVYGLCGTFETAEAALEEINRSYERAKEKGYDNRNDKWNIVCVEFTREFTDNGDFLKEETIRFVTEHAEFSTYENKFVFAY
jgi:hypothetical protein